ncbi:MAG: hypothetical protein ACYTXT_22205 [Nostoc sp.]
MKFEWDERKNQSNITKHGFDFADAFRSQLSKVHITAPKLAVLG